MSQRAINLSLAPQTVNLILRGLAKLPYEDVAALIQAISSEAAAQQQAQEPQPAAPSPADPQPDQPPAGPRKKK